MMAAVQVLQAWSGVFGAPFAPPDVAGKDLIEVVDKLLALEP